MLPTIETIWREYRDAVYPDGVPKIQERETRQAFYAGALKMLALTALAADQLDEAALRQVDAWETELLAFHRGRLAELRETHEGKPEFP